jgi:hypothetical protein
MALPSFAYGRTAEEITPEGFIIRLAMWRATVNRKNPKKFTA